MKAYRLKGWKAGGHDLDVAQPEPGAGEVLIRMGGAGIAREATGSRQFTHTSPEEVDRCSRCLVYAI